jgi:hypothetical protein
METRVLGLFVLVAALVVPGFGRAADVDAPGVTTITLKDGGTLVGTIVAEDERTLTLRTRSGVELTLPREAIGSREAKAAKSEPSSPGPLTDPNESRLMFAPTGRPLGKGNGYFSDHYVVFPGFAVGLTDNLSLSGGVSTIPALGLSEQIFYVSTSAGWTLGDRTAFAVGGLLAGGQAEDLGPAAAALYGVSTFGPPDRSLSLGLAFLAGRQQEDHFGPRGESQSSRTGWRFRDAPVVLVGGSLRLARSVSLISESWLFLGKDFELSQQPFGFAVRFFSGRLSADVGFVFVAEILDEGFPLPWLSFSYHFGPSRRATSRSGNATIPAWARATGARGRR